MYSSSGAEKLGIYGSAVASMPHLHSTLANVSPIPTHPASRLIHPDALVTYPPPPSHMPSMADQMIQREKERLQNEVKAEIELEFGNSGKEGEGEGKEGAGEREEVAGNDVEKDAKPFVEIDVRKLLLNYKILKSLLEGEDNSMSGGSRNGGGLGPSLSRGLSRRMLMHGPLARIVISMIGPRMIRHQMSFMTQTFVAELIRKMFFPIAHSLVEKKFPSLPVPSHGGGGPAAGSPSPSPDSHDGGGGSDASGPSHPSSPYPNAPPFDPGHDCRKSHPHYPHHYHHDYEKEYQKGPHRSNPPTPYQAIGVQLLPINELENEHRQKKLQQQHEDGGNDQHDSRPVNGQSDDDLDGEEDEEEDDDDGLILQIINPASPLSELNQASSKSMMTKSAAAAKMFFLDAEAILRGNKTVKLVTPVNGSDISSGSGGGAKGNRMTGDRSLNSSTIASDKDANFPVIFLVSHPDRQSNASSPSLLSLPFPTSSLSSGSKETSILIDPAILNDGRTAPVAPAAAPASDANIVNHRLENQLSSAGSSINSIRVSGEKPAMTASPSLTSMTFGFPGHVMRERVSASRENATEYDRERASRWDTIAKDMNKYHEQQREQQWQGDLGD